MEKIPAQGKPDWTKIVNESDGTMVFLPEKFQKAAEKWMKLRDEYNEHVKEMAKRELSVNHALNEMLFDLRTYLEENGHEDIYLKDLGFHTEALSEGKFIVNILDPAQRLPGA